MGLGNIPDLWSNFWNSVAPEDNPLKRFSQKDWSFFLRNDGMPVMIYDNSIVGCALHKPIIGPSGQCRWVIDNSLLTDTLHKATPVKDPAAFSNLVAVYISSHKNNPDPSRALQVA